VRQEPDFHDLVGADVEPGEEARLRRVHELLVEAGPPPEVPPWVAEGPNLPLDVAYPRPVRRRVPMLVAAALAVTAFVLGWFASGSGSSTSGFHRIGNPIEMRGTAAAPSALATIELADADAGGNWPMILHVRGLKPQPTGDYYELWLTRQGKPIASCGTFRVMPGSTDVRLNAPYKLRRFDGWIVTAHTRRGAKPLALLRTTRV
jgi:hypothetical protein